jgi:hypothetical protein
MTGTPEKPLSNLGLASYTNYWIHALAYELKKHVELAEAVAANDDEEDPPCLSIHQLSKATGMTLDDVIFGLETLQFLCRDKNAKYSIIIDKDKIDSMINRWEAKQYLRVQSDCLVWEPPEHHDQASIVEQTGEAQASDLEIDLETSTPVYPGMKLRKHRLPKGIVLESEDEVENDDEPAHLTEIGDDAVTLPVPRRLKLLSRKLGISVSEVSSILSEKENSNIAVPRKLREREQNEIEQPQRELRHRPRR